MKFQIFQIMSNFNVLSIGCASLCDSPFDLEKKGGRKSVKINARTTSFQALCSTSSRLWLMFRLMGTRQTCRWVIKVIFFFVFNIYITKTMFRKSKIYSCIKANVDILIVYTFFFNFSIAIRSSVKSRQRESLVERDIF